MAEVIALFGYVKPYRPFLRVYELEVYKAAYCGLCRQLKDSFGFAATLTLSFDVVFLTLVDIGLNSYSLEMCGRKCPVHPIGGKKCLKCSGDAFDYSACAEVILVYHKLRDDLRDKGALRKLRAAALLPVYYRDYKKAALKYPTLAKAVDRAMKLHRKTERTRTRSLDRAAEPTAAMMRAVFCELGGCDHDKRELLGQFGYMLGRYVYIVDALDDLDEDFKRREYNPLLSPRMLKLSRSGKTLPRDYREHAASAAENGVMLTLGALAEIYVKLDIGDIKPIIDNMVYLGLKHTFYDVKQATVSGEKRKNKKDDQMKGNCND